MLTDYEMKIIIERLVSEYIVDSVHYDYDYPIEEIANAVDEMYDFLWDKERLPEIKTDLQRAILADCVIYSRHFNVLYNWESTAVKLENKISKIIGREVKFPR